MTIVVIKPGYILADCRLTLKMTVPDQSGKTISIQGNTDAYRKIGEGFDLKYGEENIEAYVIFGDVETAEKLYHYFRVNGLDNLEEKMGVLLAMKPQLSSVESGFAWLTESGRIMWLTVSQNEWVFKIQEPEVEAPVVLGSGKEFFDKAFQASRDDVLCAFIYALAKDEQSSTGCYDSFLAETGSTSRYELPGNTGDVPTLEQFIASKDARASTCTE